MYMRAINFIIHFIGISTYLSAQVSESVSTPLVIGETVSFYSNELEENRSFNIYLPYGYDEEDNQRYPVIYLLDGSIDEDFLHIVGLVQFGAFPWIKMIPPSIVVGIENVDRKRDFTYPSTDDRDKAGFPTSGGSADFISYLSEELMPFIKSQYKVNDTTTLIGQSLGGLCATEILFSHSAIFTNYIIVSPSLWWDHENILKRETSHLSNSQSVYIAVGNEGDVMERVAQELYKVFSNHPKVYFNHLPDKDHGDALHLAVYNAFEAIFSTKENKK